MLKKTTLFLLCCSAATLATIPFLSSENSQAPIEASAVPSKEDLTNLSKTFGNFLGRTLADPSIGIPFNVDAIIEGIKDGAAGKPAPLNEQDYQRLMLSIQENYLKELSTKNLKAADDFLKETAKSNKVIPLKDGKILYEILTEGKDPVVKPHAEVSINYTGKLIDGTVFSSSQDSGPISISLDQTIPGLSEGLVGMKTGEKRRLYIHPDLAYGTQGDLPSNSLLIFDVEMINTGDADNTSTEKKNPNAEREEEFFEVSLGDYHGSAEYLPGEEEERLSTPHKSEADYDILDENQVNTYRPYYAAPPRAKSHNNAKGQSQPYTPFQNAPPVTPPKGGYPK